MLRHLLVFMLLCSLSEPATADSGGEAPIANHFYNGYLLQSQELDLAVGLPGSLSRYGVFDSLELQSSLMGNLAALYIPGIPYNLGLRHQLWQIEGFSTALSSLLFHRSAEKNKSENSSSKGHTQLGGSFTGIYTSYAATPNFNVNFGPSFMYYYSTFDGTVTKSDLPYHDANIISQWFLSVGFDLRLSQKVYISANRLIPVQGKVTASNDLSQINVDQLTDTLVPLNFVNLSFRSQSGDWEFGYPHIISYVRRIR